MLRLITIAGCDSLTFPLQDFGSSWAQPFLKILAKVVKKKDVWMYSKKWGNRNEQI